MEKITTDWRLWLWMGRVAGLATIVKTGAEGSFAWHAFIVCAASFGLAEYLKEVRR